MPEKTGSQIEIPDEWKMFMNDTFSPADFISRMEQYAELKPDLAQFYASNIEWAKSLPSNAKIGWRKDEIKQRFIPYQI